MLHDSCIRACNAVYCNAATQLTRMEWCDMTDVVIVVNGVIHFEWLMCCSHTV